MYIGDDLLVYFDDKTEQKQKQQQKQNNQYQAQQQNHYNQGFKNVLNCDCLCKQCINFAGYEKCICCNDCERVNPLNPTTTATKNFKLWNENLASNNENQQESVVAPQSISFPNSDFNNDQLQKIYSKTAAEPFVLTSKHIENTQQQKFNQDKFSYQQLNLLNEPNVNEFAARTNDDNSVVAMKGENGKFRGLQNNYHNEDFNYQATTNNQNGFMMKNQQLQKQGNVGVEDGDYERRMDIDNYDYSTNRDRFNGDKQLKVEWNQKPVFNNQLLNDIQSSDIENLNQNQAVDFNNQREFIERGECFENSLIYIFIIIF